jgi:hypothetical protein
MKKILLGAVLLGAIFTGCTKEETKDDNSNTKNGTTTPPVEFLASEAPTNRTLLLENYTGVRCGFCPDGHIRARAIADANPGRVIIMGIHAGSFATPSAGWPNFTTSFGQTLVTNAKISGYPAGTLNRIAASELGASAQVAGGLAMGRGSWLNASAPVLAMSAPVNIGARAKYDPATRKLTVKVDLFYTAAQTVPNNINVALLQSNIWGRQSGAPDPNRYNHSGVLRDLITGQWGEAITAERAQGAKISRTYEYTLPEHYNGADLATGGGGAVVVADLKVVVFVAQGQGQVLNALQVDVTQ